MTDIHNLASRRVLEKVGFTYIEQFNFNGDSTQWREDGELTTWYKLKNPYPIY